jgi:trehalose 6-phosphate phosphatase
MTDADPQPLIFDFTLFAELERASERVLMLDYDGTLAPFQVNRLEAKPYAGVADALRQLTEAGDTRLVIVSGRPIYEVEMLLGEIGAAEIWGAHGWERRKADGELEGWSLPDALSGTLEEAIKKLENVLPGGALETKRGAVVAHLRGASTVQRDEIATLVQECWTPLAKQDGLELRQFDGGYELRAVTRTKGTVVQMVRADSGETAHCAYLGDDLTDEDAFAELPAPHWPILVRSRPRPSKARFWLPPPEDLLRFINSWTAAGH